jgi:hypothetical protein
MPQDPAVAVAIRIRCLAAHFFRGWAEAKHAGNRQAVGISKLSARKLFVCSLAALDDPELRRALTSREKDAIGRPLGKLGQGRTAEAMFRAEPISILTWALGEGRFPKQWLGDSGLAYERFKPDELAAGRMPRFLSEPRLRPRRELLKRRNYEYAWTWRVRLEGLRLTSAIASDETGLDDAAGITELFKRQAAKAAKAAAAKGWFKPIRDDFPLYRRPFARAFALSINPGRDFEAYANERLRAMNWVLKPELKWHRVSTATPLGFTLHRRMVDDAELLRMYLNPKDDSFWY